jgi:hypothetical protein
MIFTCPGPASCPAGRARPRVAAATTRGRRRWGGHSPGGACLDHRKRTVPATASLSIRRCPSESTIRRTVRDIDADAFDTVIGGFVQQLAARGAHWVLSVKGRYDITPATHSDHSTCSRSSTPCITWGAKRRRPVMRVDSSGAPMWSLSLGEVPGHWPRWPRPDLCGAGHQQCGAAPAPPRSARPAHMRMIKAGGRSADGRQPEVGGDSRRYAAAPDLGGTLIGDLRSCRYAPCRRYPLGRC